MLFIKTFLNERIHIFDNIFKKFSPKQLFVQKKMHFSFFFRTLFLKKKQVYLSPFYIPISFVLITLFLC